MTISTQQLTYTHEAVLSHAKLVTIDQLHAADQIVQSCKLFSRNGPGYAEARLAIAQMIAQNYNAAAHGDKR